jgi:hypothetical protein
MRDGSHYQRRSNHESDGEQADRAEVEAKVAPRRGPGVRVEQYRQEEQKDQVGL